jgi:surface protein
MNDRSYRKRPRAPTQDSEGRVRKVQRLTLSSSEEETETEWEKESESKSGVVSTLFRLTHTDVWETASVKLEYAHAVSKLIHDDFSESEVKETWLSVDGMYNIHNVTSAQLIIDYMTINRGLVKYRRYPDLTFIEGHSIRVGKWLNNVIGKKMLFEVITIAAYLEMPVVLSLCVSKLIMILKEKEHDDIHRIFELIGGQPSGYKTLYRKLMHILGDYHRLNYNEADKIVRFVIEKTDPFRFGVRFTDLEDPVVTLRFTRGHAIKIDWGDEGDLQRELSFEEDDKNDEFIDIQHQYSEPGEYEIKVFGEMSGFTFRNNPHLHDIYQWGCARFHNQGSIFRSCKNLTYISAADAPNMTGVVNLSHMFDGEFEETESKQGLINVNLRWWDVDMVTDMSYMFARQPRLDTSSFVYWQPKSAVNMKGMFFRCKRFDSPLPWGKWVENVTDMSYMFYMCHSFNRNIGGWDVSKVTNMNFMFYQAQSFQWDLAGWNVRSVKSMDHMFFEATAFNSDISTWIEKIETDLQDVKNASTDIFRGAVNQLDNNPPDLFRSTQFARGARGYFLPGQTKYTNTNIGRNALTATPINRYRHPTWLTEEEEKMVTHDNQTNINHNDDIYGQETEYDTVWKPITDAPRLLYLDVRSENPNGLPPNGERSDYISRNVVIDDDSFYQRGAWDETTWRS